MRWLVSAGESEQRLVARVLLLFLSPRLGFQVPDGPLIYRSLSGQPQQSTGNTSQSHITPSRLPNPSSGPAKHIHGDLQMDDLKVHLTLETPGVVI